MKDYYKILELPKDANQNTIKKQYRKLAFENHPDRSKKTNATTIFQEINEAYSVLRDPETRRIYNAKTTPAPIINAPNNVSETFYAEVEKFLKLFTQKTNIFSSLFLDSFYYKNIKKAPDTYVEVPLLIIEMINGCRKTVLYHIQDLCPQCQGNQATKVFTFGCMCNGSGLIEIEKKTIINFPAGVIPGSEMRIKGKGTSGRNLIANGDLVFEVVIKDDEYWCDDLNIYTYCNYDINNNKINIKTPRGIYTTINEGKEIVLKKAGLFDRKTGQTGDFIAIPTNANNTKIFI